MLRDLQTDLKSLKWGKDQPFGGDSGLPYIKTGLPENSTALERIALESARFSADYPIRGGFYAIRAAAEDAIRIRKFLTDFPKGSNFTSKQVGLQKSNPLSETGKNGGRINTRTYNLNSNLELSVLTAGSGVHYPRAGANPFTLLDDDNKYFSIVGKKPTEENRLFNLYNTKILKNDGDSLLLENLGISSDPSLIMNYIGGPGSLYGDGETIILKSTDNKGIPIDTNNAPGAESISRYIPIATSSSFGDNKYVINSDIKSHLKLYNSGSNIDELLGIESGGQVKQNDPSTFKTSFNTIPYDKIAKREKYIIGTKLTDFRKDTDESFIIPFRDYSDPRVPMITRIGIGSPGARTRENRFSINQPFEGGQDKVNLLPILYKNYNDNPEETEGARDLIKFNFETIDNDSLNNTYRTHFRAFLKGFSDSNTADWEGKKYAGRGDDMYNYQGFNRSISFSFTVSAQSKQEMKPLWQKLNFLNSTLCPDYSPTNGFMRGNIHRLTIGEYLYRTPGIIKSLNYTVDDNYPWEIKIDQPEQGADQDMMEIPQIINVSVVFVPILDTLARTIKRNDFKVSALISNKVGRNNFIDNTVFGEEQQKIQSAPVTQLPADNATIAETQKANPTPPNITFSNLGKFSTPQGGNVSYFNILTNKPDYIAMKVRDPDFVKNQNGGFTLTSKDSNGDITANSFSFAGGVYVGTVAAKAAGTYYLEINYLINGESVTFKSDNFTQ